MENNLSIKENRYMQEETVKELLEKIQDILYKDKCTPKENLAEILSVLADYIQYKF